VQELQELRTHTPGVYCCGPQVKVSHPLLIVGSAGLGSDCMGNPVYGASAAPSDDGSSDGDLVVTRRRKLAQYSNGGMVSTAARYQVVYQINGSAPVVVGTFAANHPVPRIQLMELQTMPDVSGQQHRRPFCV